MKKKFLVFALTIFVAACCFSFFGCSKVRQPPAQEISNAVEKSLEETTWVMGSLGKSEIIRDETYQIKHEVFESKQKEIDGKQYEVWPIKVTGTATLKHTPAFKFVNGGKPVKYNLTADYVLYCYKNDVNEYKHFMESGENKSSCNEAVRNN